MAEMQQRVVGVCAMAAAAAGVCALTSSLSFAVGGRPAVNQPSPITVAGLRGAAQQGPETGSSLSSVVLGLAGVGTLAAAAAASKGASRRQRVVECKCSWDDYKGRKTAELPGLAAGLVKGGPQHGWNGKDRQIIVDQRTNFAMGIAGSTYHGWGKYEWDPLCLSDRFPEHLPWYREAELKHGRVAMLAFAGLIAPDSVRLPIEQLMDPGLDLVNAHNKLIGPGLGEGPMWWLLLFCGIIESIRFKQLGMAFENLTKDNAGDLGIKLFAPSTPEGWEQMKTKELKNGRLAMMAFSGAITQAVTWDVHHFPFTP